MPNGQFPAPLAGQTGVASLLTQSPWTAWKTGDTSRANNVVSAADPDLTIPLSVASAVYALSAYFRYEGGTLGSADFAWKWSVPAGTSLFASPANQNTSGAATVGGEQTAVNTVTAGSAGAGNVRSVTLRGMVFVSSTTGNLVLFWCQGTSSATATILHLGSWMSLRRLS